ncbi:MAG: hypothetical protein IJ733_09580, partial [Lachnospiraceae bacterium]|nr:hypothetical protein [Lachnospiraceae bacterium]
MRHQFLAKTLSCTLAVALALGTVSTGISFQPVTASAEEVSELQATGTYQFSTTSDWDEGGESEKNLPVTTSFIPKVGATITADVLIPGVAAFQGSIKASGILRVGSDWKWVQSNEYPALTAADFKETVTIGGKDYAKASIAIPFGGLVGANTADGWSNEVAFETAVDDVIAQVNVKFAGYQCDYSGEIAIANAKLQAEE